MQDIGNTIFCVWSEKKVTFQLSVLPVMFDNSFSKAQLLQILNLQFECEMDAMVEHKQG